MKRELQDLIDECNTDIADIERRLQMLPPLDKEISYLTYYVLIRASGTVEYVYRSIVTDYFSRLSDSRIDSYLDAKVRKGSMSATYDNMCGLLGQFDNTWRDNFRVSVSADPDKNRIIAASNSLVRNRHDFAHGRRPTATFLEIKAYYQDILRLIYIFDSIVC